MRLFSCLLPLALLLPTAVAAEAGAGGDAGAAIAVEQPWARATTASMAGAVYFTVTNMAGEPDRLTGAATPVADKAAPHTHLFDGTTLRMRPVAAIGLPPGRRVDLHPGGLHIMLTGLKGALKKGSSFPLTLEFQKAGRITVDVPVLAADAAGPAATPANGEHPHGPGDGTAGQ